MLNLDFILSLTGAIVAGSLSVGTIVLVVTFVYKFAKETFGVYASERDHRLKISQFNEARTNQINDRLEQRDKDRRDTEAAVKDGFIELQRHTMRNWKVLDQILRELRPDMLPHPLHIEKLRYVEHQRLFDPAFVNLLDQPMRAEALRLQAIVRNVNIEIDAAVDTMTTGDRDAVLDMFGLLARKFQYLFTSLPQQFKLEDQPEWLADPAIEDARAAELAARKVAGDREDVIYVTVGTAGRT